MKVPIKMLVCNISAIMITGGRILCSRIKQ